METKLKYDEFLNRTYFTKEELIAHSQGNLIQSPPFELAKLPAPPFLMIDRVTKIEKSGMKGTLVAEKDVMLDDWFFQCHFRGDPVQPGCLGVDAIWQLIGFYCCLNGAPGSGRALGCKEVEFQGQIRPHNKTVRYEVDIRRYSYLEEQGAAMAIGSGKVFVDEEHIYTVTDAKVGIFSNITYSDYPLRSANSIGGIMKREGDKQ